MTKISKTKLLLCLVLSLILLTGCFKNKYITETNGPTIEISQNLQKYFKIQTSLPKLHFEGTNINVMYDTNNSACFFVNNDHYKFSDLFSNHLQRYNEDQIFVIHKSSQAYDEKVARFGKDKLTLDEKDEFGENQNTSTEYQIVCVDDDGTRYSYQYRTFISGGKRYYIYRYVSNIGMSLEQSLMVVKKQEGKNELLLVPLPYDTKYEVSGATLTEQSLIDKDTYLEERYTKYAFPDALKLYDNLDKEEMIKAWYVKYCDGKYIGEDFIFNYYGANFKLEFGIKDAGNTGNLEGFKITYVK